MKVSERRKRSMLCFVAQQGSVFVEKFTEFDLPIVASLIDSGNLRHNTQTDTIEYVRGVLSLEPLPEPMEKTSEIVAYLENIEKFSQASQV